MLQLPVAFILLLDNRLGFNYTWAENTRLQCELSVLGVLQTRTDAEAAWDEDPGHY